MKVKFAFWARSLLMLIIDGVTFRQSRWVHGCLLNVLLARCCAVLRCGAKPLQAYIAALA
jgi:hypothetical protein